MIRMSAAAVLSRVAGGPGSDFIASQPTPHLRGSPDIHCGGIVDVFRVNLPLVECVRPQNSPSYSVMSWMLASTTLLAASTPPTTIIP